MNYWKISLYLLGLVPLGFVVSLIAFYSHAEKVLGYTPRYNVPDPKTLDIYEVYDPLISFFMVLWPYAMVLWLVTTVAYAIRFRQKISWVLIVLTTFFHAIAIMLLMSGIFEWYVD